ncbi:hypothetical protein ACG33_12690 [Steroidobacter denitrificans]|uniref:ABC transporter substrate-binding protein n=1 Tax=Steroidobacter denitrificans TaxID=465721 RepID=A0A127FDY7_STEDE|nr:hypothetical protein ACG33_12690 [Steroidobacter denitrificans]
MSRISTPAHAAGPGELVLYGPPAGPSIILAQAVQSQTFEGSGKLGFKVWRSPDEMRAGLTSGTMAAVVLPTQVAANLYNRGMKIRLLNILTQGLLYIVSTDAGIDSFPALKGRKLAVPFRNDMPDLVLAYLLKHHGMNPASDLTIQITGSPVEAMQMLLMGRVDAALVAEPAATGATIRGRLMGRKIRRVIDIQAAWAEATGRAPVLPQAGLALTDPLRTARPELAEALQTALEAAVAKVNADPQAAAELAAPFLDFPAAILAASIPTSKLVVTRARAARNDIEAMLTTLADADPAIIGGHLPDDGFYL